MSDTIIKVENISKQYRLGTVGTGTIRDDLKRWFATIRGKEDPFAEVGEVNKRNEKGTGDYVWALRDINFNVKKGEVLGIIGKNGAGKSTLLKILSKITQPTTGSIKIKGRVASLLEVGTGFHPELSGRENVFQNGAIMGMTKSEIRSKFDEIVAFSGVERYIDTPVKRYSSGMYVRLAFAVAAHLEPEILIIDEVLAVGDAEFQKKCLGKMKDVSSQGRTVLFVSHNLQAVSNLCTTGLFLEHGNTAYLGGIEECIKKYMVSSREVNLSTASLKNRLARTNGSVLFTEIRPMKRGAECWDFNSDEDIFINFKAIAQRDTENLLFYMAFKHPFSGETITNFKKIITENLIKKDEIISFSVSLPGKSLRSNQYGIYLALFDKEAKVSYDVIDSNVNLPMLNIDPVTMDVHENDGFFTAPFVLNVNN